MWRTLRHLVKQSKKRAIRFGLLGTHLVLAAVIAVFVIAGTNSQTSATRQALLSTSNESLTATALDELSSADVAVQIAGLTGLEEATAVANYADTVNAQLAVVPSDDKVVAKPQIVSTSLKSRKDIITYTSVEGDTIAGLASKFGVTSDTIRWSNNLRTENINPGTELLISPVNGLVYRVKSGDTIDSIASRYRANKTDLIAYNDAELTGSFKEGELIIIKDGSIAPPVVRTAARPVGFPWGGGPVYGYNGYDYGYCTWYAAQRRAAVGKPVPANLGNACTWLSRARSAGIPTGSVPQTHAVIWTKSGCWGHVGFVEDVRADGSVYVSEMNVAGWNRVSYKTLSPEAAAGYMYIY